MLAVARYMGCDRKRLRTPRARLIPRIAQISSRCLHAADQILRTSIASSAFGPSRYSGSSTAAPSPTKAMERSFVGTRLLRLRFTESTPLPALWQHWCKAGEYAQQWRGMHDVLPEPARRRIADDNQVISVDHGIGSFSAADAGDVEHGAHALALDVPEDHDLVELRRLGLPLRQGKDIEQGRGPGELIDTRLRNFALNGDLLRDGARDGDGHLWVFEVLRAE